MISKQYLDEIFDYKDGELYWKVANSPIVKVGEKAGHNKIDGYITIGVNKKVYKAHRLIFMFHHGYFPIEIDHINGIKNDNRIENLREVTHIQNSMNRKIRSDNLSKCKGVTWNTNNKAWAVRISINKKRKLIGYFKDLELADLVSNEARNKYHKEFANNG